MLDNIDYQYSVSLSGSVFTMLLLPGS